jgi:hypothetical protein
MYRTVLAVCFLSTGFPFQLCPSIAIAALRILTNFRTQCTRRACSEKELQGDAELVIRETTVDYEIDPISCDLMISVQCSHKIVAAITSKGW